MSQSAPHHQDSQVEVTKRNFMYKSFKAYRPRIKQKPKSPFQDFPQEEYPESISLKGKLTTFLLYCMKLRVQQK